MGQKVVLSKEEKARRKHCNKCIFSMKLGMYQTRNDDKRKGLDNCHCGYILITGNMRGCKGGLECNKYCTDKNILKQYRYNSKRNFVSH